MQGVVRAVTQRRVTMPKLWSWADSEDVERTLRRLGVDGLSGAAFEEFVGDLFRLTGFDVETPGGAGTQEGLSRIQTLIDRVFAEQMEGRITRGAPERSEMRALLED